MIGPTEILIAAAITMATTPPMTDQEIRDAFEQCDSEKIYVLQNSMNKIIKVQCDV